MIEFIIKLFKFLSVDSKELPATQFKVNSPSFSLTQTNDTKTITVSGINPDNYSFNVDFDNNKIQLIPKE